MAFFAQGAPTFCVHGRGVHVEKADHERDRADSEPTVAAALRASEPSTVAPAPVSTASHRNKSAEMTSFWLEASFAWSTSLRAHSAVTSSASRSSASSSEVNERLDDVVLEARVEASKQAVRDDRAEAVGRRVIVPARPSSPASEAGCNCLRPRPSC